MGEGEVSKRRHPTVNAIINLWVQLFINFRLHRQSRNLGDTKEAPLRHQKSANKAHGAKTIPLFFLQVFKRFDAKEQFNIMRKEMGNKLSEGGFTRSPVFCRKRIGIAHL